LASDDNSAGDGRNSQIIYTFPAAGTYSIRVRPKSGGGEYVLSVSPLSEATVVGRRLFYNNSAFDGANPAANAADDAAMAADKTALLPNGTAAFANVSSYDRGINGLFIDVANLPAGAGLAADDFEFRAGNGGDPNTWPLVEEAPVIGLRRGAGTNNSDRIAVAWPDRPIVDKWLRVVVRATEHTGLAHEDVHYWGSAVGDTGNVEGDFRVDFADHNATRRNFAGSVDPENRYDFNRDGRVDEADASIVLQHANGLVADLNRDDAVGLADLVLLHGSFGVENVANSYLGDIDGDGVVGASDVALVASSLGARTAADWVERRLSPIVASVGSSHAAGALIVERTTGDLRGGRAAIRAARQLRRPIGEAPPVAPAATDQIFAAAADGERSALIARCSRQWRVDQVGQPSTHQPRYRQSAPA
jgi:hypothetical protein